jgi:predicted Rossmann fold flavoprotein
MQGLSLKNVSLSLWGSKNGLLYEDFGEMQFTHFGISGPLVLSCSAHMNQDTTETYYVSLDLKPALDDKKLDVRLLRDFEKYSNKDFRNALSDLALRLMIPVLVERSKIPPDTKVNAITKQQRTELIRLFKDFTIHIKGPRPISEAVITAGGVNVKEINPSTMESKIISGLFFAGEMIDVDAYTGGFNLQIAWSTGRAQDAARHNGLRAHRNLNKK